MSRPYRRAIVALPLLLLVAPIAAQDGFSLKPIGNFQYDLVRVDEDERAFRDDQGFRRARPGFAARWGRRFEAKLEYELTASVWTDAYVAWKDDRWGRIRAGQYKQPFHLEELGSSKWTTFLERGLPSSLGIVRRVGVEYAKTGDHWTVALSRYGQDLEGLDEGDGWAARGTWTPWRNDAGLLHLGIAASTKEPESQAVRFRARAEARLSDVLSADTGTIGDVDRLDRVGLEAAWQRGPWSAQAEYVRAEAERAHGSDIAGDGWYAYVSWFPTGHHRSYRDGVFDAPVFDGRDAWELALRVSHLDLDRGDLDGGRVRNWTAGVNWYPHAQWRFSVNWVHVNAERDGLQDDPRILELRTQLVY